MNTFLRVYVNTQEHRRSTKRIEEYCREHSRFKSIGLENPFSFFFKQKNNISYQSQNRFYLALSKLYCVLSECQTATVPYFFVRSSGEIRVAIQLYGRLSKQSGRSLRTYGKIGDCEQVSEYFRYSLKQCVTEFITSDYKSFV